jgi:NAD-dependent SIR2 family protein deacetylase
MQETLAGSDAVRRAAGAIAGADGIIIGAGAGMGVDSGLPDFRGREGFWRAYPPYAHLGLDFAAMANPRWFREDPALAWGFYGHRVNLYRNARPHEGFAILREWSAGKAAGSFVYTSNVDGQFQRAGFEADRVFEVHGAIGRIQCVAECGIGLLPSHRYGVEVDPETFRALGPLPACPRCGATARPNILMFGDLDWDSSHSDAQRRRLGAWLRSHRSSRLVIVECGAGTAVPTVRLACEDLAETLDATLIRINPRDPDVPPGHIALAAGALEALRAIDAVFHPPVYDRTETPPARPLL